MLTWLQTKVKDAKWTKWVWIVLIIIVTFFAMYTLAMKRARIENLKLKLEEKARQYLNVNAQIRNAESEERINKLEVKKEAIEQDQKLLRNTISKLEKQYSSELDAIEKAKTWEELSKS